MYVDGELIIEGEKETSNFDWQKNVNIGFSNDAAIHYLNGGIDELRIWDAALEQEEIQERMNQPLEGDEDWLLAYYAFDQAEGDSLVDSTENKFNGVLIINITRGTLHSAPSVNGPWENVPAPLQLNSDAMGAAEFFRAVNP
ncbi:MAG: hypothetical protein CBC62_10825 [Opitutia bacterium TMED102]|nr:MAG: hypothetical protein CBC62_10825 [Opitutae bacterium TMED102]